MDRVISSLTHPVVKHLVSLRDDSAYRELNNSVLVQGRKMLLELSATRELRLVVAADQSLVPPGIRAAEVIVANEAILQKIAGVVTPDGIVAEVEKPAWSTLEGATRVVALDGVSDPGNVGTLIRTALALGWQGVYFLDGCCDPYNDKALRAAMGATFRIPLAKGNWTTLQSLISQRHWVPFVADLDGLPVEHVSWEEGVLLVLGNEAKGPSDTSRAHCKAVTIPMSGAMDSLNVSIAGAILIYVLGRTDHV